MILLPPRISLVSRNPTLSLQTLIRPLSISVHLSSLSPMAPPPPPPELVAEYAKSGRSSCKGCGNAIAAGALRLGLSSKDPRGFDNVKWHHLDCFPANTQPIRDAEGVKGFPALKESDQEAIKKLEAAASIEQSDKLPAAAKDNSLGVDFSVSGVKDKYKVLAEYAKSGRSSCKSCGEAIAAGSLRLGLSTKDPRGFDFVKWLHLDCFPAQFQLVSASEEIDGFSSLKNCDQEALKKLETGASIEQSDKKVKLSDKKMSSSTNQSSDNSDEEFDELVLDACVLVATFLGSYVQKHYLKQAKHAFGYKGWMWFKDVLGGHDSSRHDMFQMEKKVHERDDDSGIGNSDQWTSKKAKIHNQVDTESADSEERTKAALQLSGSGEERGLEIDFSVSDIKEKYKDATLPSNWKAYKTIIFREREDGLRDSEKIAAFDFDGCLVNTSVKRIGPDAWSLMYPSIPGKLQELYNSGYKLVIFTNESNIERWKNKRQQAVDSKIGRLDNFIKQVKVPIQVFIACGIGKNKDQMEDFFRKPNPGMWRLMEGHFNSGIAINMDQSFYVGDAAGRFNDHSYADSKFAQAVGLKFHLPEEFFSA